MADLEFEQEVVSQNIQHFISSKIPDTETLLNGVSSHHFAIQIVDFDKIGILEYEIFE